MKKVIALFIATALLVGIYLFVTQILTPNVSGPAEKIRVANIGIYTIHNLIAEDRGYFKKHGLEAVITEYDSGATSIGAVLSGKADVAIAADAVGVANIFNHPNLRILAEVSHHDVFRVIGRQDKGIVSPKSLKGRRIGVTRKTAAEYYLGQFLIANGLRLADVVLVDLSPTDMIRQLENGQLDVIITFEPHAYEIEKSLGDQVVIWSAQGDAKALGLLYTTSEFIEARPEAIERYLAALLDSEKYVSTHKGAARDFIGAKLNYENNLIESLWTKFDFSIGLEQYLFLTMEDQARWMIENKLTDKKAIPNYLDYIYFDALEGLKPDAITIIH